MDIVTGAFWQTDEEDLMSKVYLLELQQTGEQRDRHT